MLENDTSTIAVEVPVYLETSTSTIPWIKSIKSNNNYITGHIDLLQYRNGKLYILDYKPGAKNEKPIGQLFVYACCLSKSTRIHFSNIILAWFDENLYYETNAMQVYKYVMSNFK
nr:PD-(D/E)XK nuclease family protein [Lentimicrobium sp. S6]